MLRSIPALPVQSIKNSIQFYCDKLGFKAFHQEKEFAIIGKDEVKIHLWAANDESWRTRKQNLPISLGTESFMAGTASCRIEVDGITEFYQNIKQLNIIHPNGPLQNQPWGERDFSIVDIDNNLITFFQKNKQFDE